MSVKDRAKMFSNSNSDQDLKKGLISQDNNKSSSPSIFTKISSSFSNCFSSIKTAITGLCGDKKSRYIIIGVFAFVFLLIIIIIIVSLATKNGKPSNEFEKVKSNEYCANPYDIEVYTEDLLKWNLTNCGYKEGTLLFNFSLSAIRLHNLYRACHNATPLYFNCEIMKIAQNYSEYLANDVGSLVHSKTRFHGEWMGENLAGFMGTNGETPTKMWYNEYSNYDFNSPGFSSGTGHFTQVVWKNSKQFGIGYSCKNSFCYVTGNYYPGGNFGYTNDYKNNVQDIIK